MTKLFLTLCSTNLVSGEAKNRVMQSRYYAVSIQRLCEPMRNAALKAFAGLTALSINPSWLAPSLITLAEAAALRRCFAPRLDI